MTLVKLVKTVVAALEEIKARDIEVLDVKKLTALFDRMIIASADSSRQTRAIANNVVEKVKAAGGTVYGVEGEQNGEWILVDLGDVLVHVMQTAIRAHYNLEELWAEAVKINKIPARAIRSSSTAGTSGEVQSTDSSEPDPEVKKAGAIKTKADPADEV
jgi:ribosome-associated protein